MGKRKAQRPRYTVHTDGAISKPHGPGGWACVIRSETTGVVKEFSGIKEVSTNSTLELQAVIQALWQLNSRSCRIHIVSDSQYVVKAFTENRLRKWQANGWVTSNKEPVKNKELWETLWALCQMHQVSFEWVRGHDGHPENERADELAREASALARKTFGEAPEGQDSPEPETDDTGQLRLSYGEARERMKT